MGNGRYGFWSRDMRKKFLLFCMLLRKNFFFFIFRSVILLDFYSIVVVFCTGQFFLVYSLYISRVHLDFILFVLNIQPNLDLLQKIRVNEK